MEVISYKININEERKFQAQCIKKEEIFKNINVMQYVGLLLVQAIDQNLGFTKFIADKVENRRNRKYITQHIENLLTHRMYNSIGSIKIEVTIYYNKKRCLSLNINNM